MSLINDALKRAQQAEVRTKPAEEVPLEYNAQPQRKSKTHLTLLMLVAIGLPAGLLVLFGSRPSPQRDEVPLRVKRVAGDQPIKKPAPIILSEKPSRAEPGLALLKESQKMTLPSVSIAGRQAVPSAPALVAQEQKVAPTLSTQRSTAVLLARAEIPDSAKGYEHTGSSTFRVYVIQGGDTLTRIAKAHGTTVKALRAVNPNIRPDRIAVGQKIRLPSDKQLQVAL